MTLSPVLFPVISLGDGKTATERADERAATLAKVIPGRTTRATKKVDEKTANLMESVLFKAQAAMANPGMGESVNTGDKANAQHWKHLPKDNLGKARHNVDGAARSVKAFDEAMRLTQGRLDEATKSVRTLGQTVSDATRNEETFSTSAIQAAKNLKEAKKQVVEKEAALAKMVAFGKVMILLALVVSSLSPFFVFC